MDITTLGHHVWVILMDHPLRDQAKPTTWYPVLTEITSPPTTSHLSSNHLPSPMISQRHAGYSAKWTPGKGISSRFSPHHYFLLLFLDRMIICVYICDTRSSRICTLQRQLHHLPQNKTENQNLKWRIKPYNHNIFNYLKILAGPTQNSGKPTSAGSPVVHQPGKQPEDHGASRRLSITLQCLWGFCCRAFTIPALFTDGACSSFRLKTPCNAWRAPVWLTGS